MSFVVAVPTFRRTGILAKKTLAYLDRSGIAPEAIHVLVADDAELAAYTAVLDPGYRVAVTAPGLRESRRVAQETLFEEGQRILWLDDDVDALVRRVNGKTVEEVTNLEETVEEAFHVCSSAGAHLWGVYPTANAFYMTPRVRSDLRHIVGAFYGVVNRRDPALLGLEFGDAKEDYERSLRHFERDLAVIRFEYLAVKTSYYRGDSGGITDRTPDTVEENVQGLLARWPGWVKRNPRRKSGYPEILIGL